MRHDSKEKLQEHAGALGLTPEVLCVRLAKKLGFQRRIIVRSRAGGLRIVPPGQKLHLKKDEFIANVPRSMVVEALRELKSRQTISESDLDD